MKRLNLFIIAALFLAACGTSAPTPPPIIVQPNPVSDGNTDHEYLNILLSSVEFLDSVGDPDGTGELQMIVIVSDESGHADALICPYGAVIEIQKGDNLNPCKAGLTFPQQLIGDQLYVVLIAVDIDDTSVLTDIGTTALTTGLSFGMGKAIVAIGTLNPEAAPVVIGLLALDAIVGYAGGQVQEYFEKSEVLGSQSFVLSRSYDWNKGQPITASSVNNQVNFSFRVQKSSTVGGKVVEATPVVAASVVAAPVEAATNTPKVLDNTPTGSGGQNYSDPGDFARWYFTSIWKDRNFQDLWDNYLTQSFRNHASDGSYQKYIEWWDTVTKIDIQSIDVIKSDSQNAWIRVTLTFYINDGRVLKDRKYDYDLIYNKDRKTWMFDYHD